MKLPVIAWITAFLLCQAKQAGAAEAYSSSYIRRHFQAAVTVGANADILIQDGKQGAQKTADLSEDSKEGDALPYYDLLIVIPAHAEKDLDRRNAIRESWAKYVDGTGFCAHCGGTKRTTKIVFMLGQEGDPQKVAQEAAEHKDVAVLPGYGEDKDIYTNLASKVRQSITFAVNNYMFAMLLKADTDSYVFLDRFLKYVNSKDLFREPTDTRVGVYGGNFKAGVGSKPIERPGKRWSDLIFSKITGHSFFPRHAKGPGYLLSPSLCRFIAESSPSPKGVSFGSWAQLPPLRDLPNEDVSVGWWLEAVAHHQVELPVALWASGCTQFAKEDSHMPKDAIIDHKVSAKLMKLRWEQFTKTGNSCTAEVVKEGLLETQQGMDMDRAWAA